MTPTPHLSVAPTAPSSATHRWQLPNGLIVIFQEDHRHPLVAMEAVVKTGSATEGPWMGTGVSHVLEHMLFKGTTTRPVGAIEREVKSYGGQINAHTSYDTTGYAMTIHRDHFAKGVDLLADALRHPSFDPAELKKELEVVFRELKLRKDDPDSYVAELVWANSYREHPYRHPIIGYEPLLKALTRDDMIRYHQTHYMPNRTVLGIAGNVDPNDVRQAVERAFGAWPRGIEPDQPAIREPEPVTPRFVEEEVDLVHTQCLLVFPSVSLASADLFALDTLARVLGEGRGSRLDVRLKEAGIVHEVSAWNYTPKDPGLFAIHMRLDAQKVAQALAEVRTVLGDIQSNGVSAAELAAAKRAVIAQYLFGRQTVDAQAADLASNETLLSDAEFSRHYVEAIQAVTVPDLQRVARTYCQSHRATQVTVYPKGSSAKSATAATPLLDAKTELFTLDNGLRLLVRTDARAPIASLRVTSFGGLLYETPESNGVATLTGRMLLRGTASYSGRELTELVRSLGGEIRSVSGRSSLGVGLNLLSQDVATGLRLLADVWTQPTFPADEFLKEQRLLLAEIDHQEDDLFQWAGRRFSPRFFAGHPYGFPVIGQKESVSQMTVQKVKAFYQRLIDPAKTVISVYGDVRAPEIVAEVKNLFGLMRGASSAPVPVAPAPALNSLEKFSAIWPREEAIVLVGFRSVRLGDPEFPVFELIDTLLGGGGGRLFTEVREKKGRAYTVGSYLVSGVDPGGLVLYAVTSPANAQSVVDDLLGEVKRLGATVVPEEELAVAKQGLIGTRAIGLQTNGALSLQNSLDELYGLGWKSYETHDDRVRAVTAKQIQQLAQKMLRPDACVVFVGQPEPAVPFPGVPGSKVGSKE